MDFTDRIMALAARIRDVKELATTEETTKAALINPFLQALGYEPSDPRVVCFEYTADVGVKKGEKADYVVKRDGEVIFVIEAKCVGACLDSQKAAQLHRYFHTLTKTRIGILTDGVRYEFFSDLDNANVMDARPFMVFDFNQMEEALILELKKLANDSFDVSVALAAAQNLKHIRQLKALIQAEAQSPTDAFVKHFASQVVDGPMRATVLEEFRPKVALAFAHYVNDVLMKRIQGVARPNSYEEVLSPDEQSTQDEERTEIQVVTTQEEIEGYLLVKAILREVVDPERVFIRDRQSYCGILLDDNGRKPICRLHFNSTTVKHLGTFDIEKNETRHKISGLNDIYKHAETLKETALSYLDGEK